MDELRPIATGPKSFCGTDAEDQFPAYQPVPIKLTRYA
jgi:hypothetical protein